MPALPSDPRARRNLRLVRVPPRPSAGRIWIGLPLYCPAEMDAFGIEVDREFF